MVADALPTTAAVSAYPTRVFGRFELRRLLGKSSGTMTWLAFDPQSGAEVMLNLPRVQPVDDAALDQWQHGVRLASRLDHPRIAPAAEIGVQDHWPFIAVDRSGGATLGEWLAEHPPPTPAESVGWLCDLLRGLAFAHEAGAVHLDLQPHTLVIGERGGLRVMAFGCAGSGPGIARPRSNARTMALDTGELQAQRALAVRDLLACGLILHRLLAGEWPLEQPDVALVVARLAPLGRELARLPWTTPMPVPEALREIANRATSSQERLRYQSARTFLGALSGWLDAHLQSGSGPIERLLDRLGSVGHLPALPGLAARVARLTGAESQRTDEIADEVLDDMALSFELLRTLNSAKVQGTQVQGNGPVLTLRRIISLIGVDGVRLAANALRAWPGPLSEPQAEALRITLDRVRLAAHAAQALRPKGYDAQVVYLITTLQNLGRLMLRYHFADEALQIEQLMRPSPAANEDAGEVEQPGLSEEAAAFAVLGVDIDSLGTAVARHWGLSAEVMHMARRLPADAPVRRPDSDAEALRLTASAANDAVDAIVRQAGPRARNAMLQVGRRYARALGLGPRDLSEALHAARDALKSAGDARHRHALAPEARRGSADTDADTLVSR